MRPIALTLALSLSAFSAVTLGAEHTKDSLDVVKKRIAAGEAVLVDVREQAEWNEAHVEGAQFVPLSALRDPAKRKEAAAKLPKDKVLYCHCRSGRRALVAAGVLKEMGYKAEALKPGLQQLLDAGFPKAK